MKKINYDYYNENVGLIREFCKVYKNELIDSQVKLLVKAKKYWRMDIDVEGYRRYMTEASIELFTGNMIGTMLYQESALAKMKQILDGTVSLESCINAEGIIML